MSIKFQKVSHLYDAASAIAYPALKDVSIEIKKHRFTAIIGHTGSGKTTLVQHLNALLLASSGTVIVDDYRIGNDKKVKDLKQLRKKVGLVFQFPEYQLFEESVVKDVAFGPKNFGVSEEAALQLAKRALLQVGLDESYLGKSPFELSGGQKRRVAIAGILALDPDILVLDEPTAGLDPQGAKEMMELFIKLQREENKTIIMVTHDMEHVYKYCDYVVVLEDGKVLLEDETLHFFQNKKVLDRLHITLPKAMQLKYAFIEKGIDIQANSYHIEDIIQDALEVLSHE
ncbi:MAG: energy-coupling factor transporter ATPase [Breznakia sp.]